MPHRGFYSGLGVIASSSLVLAQPPAPENSAPVQKQNLLASQMDIGRMVDLAAARLGYTIDYDPAAIKGPITLRINDGGQGLTDEELWQLVNHVLSARGFTTIRTPPAGPSSFSIVKLTDAAGLAPVMPRADTEGPHAGFRSEVVRVKHRPVREVVEQLTKVASKPAGSVQALGESGLIVLSDLGPRLEQSLGLLEALDRPSAPAVIEEIALVNLSAAQMVTLAMQVNAKREALGGGGGGGGGTAATSAPPGTVGPATAVQWDKALGEVIAAPDGNAVILIAPESRAEAWRSLIRQLDRRQRVEMVTYSAGAFPSKDVAKLIEQAVRTPAAASGATVVDDRFRVVLDDLTGSLMVTGTPAQHQIVASVIARLEATPAAARRPARSFVIKNRPVREVQGILEQLLQAGVLEAPTDAAAGPASSTSSGTGTPTGQVPAGVATTPMPPPPVPASSTATTRTANPSSSGRGVIASDRSNSADPLILTCDEGTNTLMAVGEPRLLAQVQTLLKTIDVRQPQVMLEVLMVTLTDAQTLNLGVELEKLEISSDLFTRLSSLFGLGARGSDGDRHGPSDALGFTGVVLSPGSFSVIVRALETLNHGRSVSMPRLLVGNNQEATFDSVIQQPYASVNASSTVSTTSFGGSQDAGTVVAIKPQIAEGDHLLLEYSVSLSAFLGTSSAANLPPPRQQNRVQSLATIPDGHTVVVGGIEVTNQSKTTSQVPFLGNIPILGEAFKSRNNTDNKSTFYIFIRATVLRSQGFEDLKYISQRQAQDAQVDDGWPIVEPSIIP